jgi:1-deoxy-D-xylulose-5-phosphate synthase
MNRAAGPVLARLGCPSDLQALSREEQEILAQELRELVIRTVAANGGHLASNLGVVELTIALLTVFGRPEDRIIWDVGHQCYVHKILTGRCDRFGTLRCHGGLSGFPRREESPWDAFDTGHSGTSISAAGGILEGKRLQGRGGRVVAVIGDGSMTSGLAFEGLNHAGHLRRNPVVILNDNEMSISENVGALSSYMSRLMTGHLSTRVREEVERFLKSFSGLGESVLKVARRAEESLKAFIIPGILFEELGFTYVGPIPGHQLEPLIQTLRNVRELAKPILVHVVTRKGMGYRPAEEHPAAFHGIGPFDPATGKPLPSQGPPSYTDVFSRTLVDLAERDRRVVAITAAMPEGTGLHRFQGRFPDRFYDVGIAEQHAVTFAAGMAVEGLRPVVAVYSTFLQRAYDQIIHDVCLTGLPVVFALDRGGIVGEDGATHQGIFDLSYLRTVPGLVIMVPRDEEELRHMLYTALQLEGPTAIRYPRGRGTGVPPGDGYRLLDPGRGEVLLEGTGGAILAVGASVEPALRAGLALRARGVPVMVVNARFVRPLDLEILGKAADTGAILTVEENVLAGGFGSAVLEALADQGRREVAVRRLGVPDRYVEHGPPAVLRRLLGLDEEGIVAAMEDLLARRGAEPGGAPPPAR